jgi:hypothetical protein
MAYFYFDFRDLDKKSRRNLLSSLLVQLSTCSNAFCDILSRLYTAHDNGARQASEKDLTQCLSGNAYSSKSRTNLSYHGCP